MSFPTASFTLVSKCWMAWVRVLGGGGCVADDSAAWPYGSTL